jgi:hypothetical protein
VNAYAIVRKARLPVAISIHLASYSWTYIIMHVPEVYRHGIMKRMLASISNTSISNGDFMSLMCFVARELPDFFSGLK